MRRLFRSLKENRRARLAGSNTAKSGAQQVSEMGFDIVAHGNQILKIGAERDYTMLGQRLLS